MIRRTTLVAAVLALLAGALLAGCGSGGNGATDHSTTAGKGVGAGAAAALAQYRKEPDTLPNWPPLSKAPPRGKHIYYIHSGGGTGQIISDAMKQAAETLGWSYRVLTFDPANPATANSAYLTAINSGADGIVSSGMDSHVLQQALDAAKAKGIPIVQIQSAEPPGSTSFAHVANNIVSRTLYGKVLALGILADAHKRGITPHVAVVTTSGIPTIYGLAQAKVKALSRLCPSCTATLVDVPVAQISSGQAPQAVVSFVQQHPDTDYVSIDGPFEGGLRAALNAAGASKVSIVGLQPTPAQNQEVQSGDSLFWVNISYGYYAWTVIDAFARAFTGGDVAIHNNEPDRVWLVDRGNLSFDPKVLPDYPVGYREQFKKLWHVG